MWRLALAALATCGSALNQAKPSVQNAPLAQTPPAAPLAEPAPPAPLARPEYDDGPMRILVVCLQSAGCSLFMKLLGQEARTTSFIDVGIFVPPRALPTPHDLVGVGHHNFVAMKCTIRGDEIVEPLSWVREIIDQFQPHKTILFIRDPTINYRHMLTHVRSENADQVDYHCRPEPDSDWGYGNRCGTPLGKLRALERLHRNQRSFCDAIVRYSDLVGGDAERYRIVDTMTTLGFPLTPDHFAMAKNTEAVTKIARELSRSFDKKFDFGNGDVTDGPIVPHEEPVGNSHDAPDAHKACPRLAEEFQGLTTHVVVRS